MGNFQLSYHLIPDGTSTIVKLEIKGEFVVSTANAAKEAEDVAVKLLSRITTASELQIRQQMEAGKWLGEGWRPDEPPAPTEEDD